ncbi:MAG: YitT family protein [Ruminococcaceae bacterium]|nr:YitT family protein [Oscillospiraceae bacterium]
MNKRELIGDFFSVILGSLIFSMSLNMFLLPASIVLGGMTGIATVLNILTGFPVGIAIILLNVPLVLLNAKKYGRRFLICTIIGVTATSLATDFLPIFPVSVTDPLICSVFGGITMGAAVGILLSRGFTTGGTDLIATLLKPLLPNVSGGTVIMMADLVIILGAAIVTKDFSGIFYSLICTVTAGKVTDLLLSGARRAVQAIIITEKSNAIREKIMGDMGRGVTILEGRGGYSGEEKQVLLCVVGKRELHELRSIVYAMDAAAFVIVSDAAEVTGEGFASRSAGGM